MKVQNIILCDEVRKEDNGKNFIIGVYPHNILIEDFPATIVLTLWIQFHAEENGPLSVEFRAIDKNKNTLTRGEGTLDIKDCKIISTITVPHMPINLTEKTEILVFQMRQKTKRWKTIKEMPVEKRKKPT